MFVSSLLLVGLAGGARAQDACDAALEVYVEEVRAKGREAAYRCLALRPEAGAHVVAWIDAAPPDETGRERVQRALALHLVERLDAPVDGAALHALGPSDQRLLRDAVYARRGRKSPSAEHDRVFSNFAWYAPDPGFTNGRLTELDRANLALIDHPPKPAAPGPVDGPEPAAAALPRYDGPTAETQVETWCGCGYGGGAGGAGLLWLGALAVASRRRGQGRRQSADTGPGFRPPASPGRA